MSKGQFHDRFQNSIDVGDIVIYTFKTHELMQIGVVEKYTPKGITVRPFHFGLKSFSEGTDSLTEFFIPYGLDIKTYEGIIIINGYALQNMFSNPIVEKFNDQIRQIRGIGGY